MKWDTIQENSRGVTLHSVVFGGNKPITIIWRIKLYSAYISKYKSIKINITPYFIVNKIKPACTRQLHFYIIDHVECNFEEFTDVKSDNVEANFMLSSFTCEYRSRLQMNVFSTQAASILYSLEKTDVRAERLTFNLTHFN